MEDPKESSTENNYFTQPPFEVQKSVTIKMNKLEKISYILASSSIVIGIFFALNATFGGNASALLGIFGYSIYLLVPTTILTIGLGFYEFFSIKRLKDLNSDKRIVIYGVRFGLFILGFIIAALMSLYLYKVLGSSMSMQNANDCGTDVGCGIVSALAAFVYAMVIAFLVMVNTVYIFSCFIADKIYVYFLNRKIEK